MKATTALKVVASAILSLLFLIPGSSNGAGFFNIGAFWQNAYAACPALTSPASASDVRSGMEYYTSSSCSKHTGTLTDPTAGTPATITGLKAWIKPHEMSWYSNGNSVYTVRDYTSNGLDAVSGITPTFQTNVLNGYSILRFNGVNQSATNSTMAALGTGAFSLFIVAKTTTLSGLARSRLTET